MNLKEMIGSHEDHIAKLQSTMENLTNIIKEMQKDYSELTGNQPEMKGVHS